MLLTRTKILIDQVSFIQKFKSNTISDEELESLYYGMHKERRYFQASDTQKLNNWDKPTNEYHSKTDTIIDLILNIAPAMTDETLRNINLRLITIEQQYADQNQVIFMRKATLAKYLWAYEMFRIETNTQHNNETIKQLIDNMYVQIEERGIKALDIDTLKSSLTIAKLHLLIHLLSEKIELLKDSNKYLKRLQEFKELKSEVQTAVENNYTENNKIAIYKRFIAFDLKLNTNIAKMHREQFKERQKKEAAQLRFECRSVSAIKAQPKVSQGSLPTRPSSASASASAGRYEETTPQKSLFNFFSMQDLSGKHPKDLYSISPGMRSSSSTSGTSSMSSSLSGLGRDLHSPEIKYLEAKALNEGEESQDEDNLPRAANASTPYRSGV